MKLARLYAAHTAVTTLLFVGIASTGYNPSFAVSVGSSGGLNVDTDTDFFLPTTATGDLCVGVLPPFTFAGNGGLSVPCTASGKTKAGASIVVPGRGYLTVPKFPSPVNRFGSINNTIDTASAEWTSAGSNFLTRRAFHEVSALAAVGAAAAESKDPWFFSPTVTTELNLFIEIEDVLLSVSDLGLDESATAGFSSVGAFGIGSTLGENILAEWDFFEENSTEDDISIPSLTLFEGTFTLEPNQTYWLTADVAATAVGNVINIPEPSSIFGLIAFLGGVTALKRKKTVSN